MPDEPDETAVETIGGLCFDAGVAMRMNWCAETSVACEGVFAGSLTNLFGYANAIWKRYSKFVLESNKVEEIQRAVYANLDAKCPVMLSIDLPSGGHSVVLTNDVASSTSTLLQKGPECALAVCSARVDTRMRRSTTSRTGFTRVTTKTRRLRTSAIGCGMTKFPNSSEKSVILL